MASDTVFTWKPGYPRECGPGLRGWGVPIRAVLHHCLVTDSVAVVFTLKRCFRTSASRRAIAGSIYDGSTSTPMELRPVCMAAMSVEQLPANGSTTVSPANENIRINRAATATGYGAGWLPRVDAPPISVQIDLHQL